MDNQNCSLKDNGIAKQIYLGSSLIKYLLENTVCSCPGGDLVVSFNVSFLADIV